MEVHTRAVCFLVMVVCVCTLRGGSAAPARHTATFNVVSFGAKGDNKTEDTAAFQAAIDAAAASGVASVVEAPPGKVVVVVCCDE